ASATRCRTPRTVHTSNRSRRRPLPESTGASPTGPLSRPNERQVMTGSTPAPSGPANPPTFPIDEVARQPLPGMIAPGDFAFSPDDRPVSFLWSPEGSLTPQLCQLDPQTGQQRLL